MKTTNFIILGKIKNNPLVYKHGHKFCHGLDYLDKDAFTVCFNTFEEAEKFMQNHNMTDCYIAKKKKKLPFFRIL